MSDCSFKEKLPDNLLETVKEKMHELEKILNYTFNDINNLSNAMCGTSIYREQAGENSKDYYNDSLAVVGDAIIKTVLSESLFKRGLFKGEITIIKEQLEKNDSLFNYSNKINLKNYVFNNHGFYFDTEIQERAPYSKHNQYFEAIVGAVYFDSDFDKCRKWLLENIYTDSIIEDMISKYHKSISS